MTIEQLEQMAAVGTAHDVARERRENADAMALCDEIEDNDYERAADYLEAVGHKDNFGRPLPGHESPRYLDARQRDYRAWLLSPAGERTRRNAHPELEARLQRAGRTTSEPASFKRRDTETLEALRETVETR